MIIFLSITTIALITIALLTIMNVFVMPRLHIPTNGSRIFPFVSILVPARNEAHIIQKTVAQLLSQDYPNYEVIIMDDASTDDTGSLARQAGQGNNRLKVLNGTPLPEDWLGKNWACHNLSQHATGDLLVFTDADTLWHSQSLSALINDMSQANVDLYTVWPTQITKSLAERLIVPLIAFVVLGYLPIILTHYSPFSLFAAANGQCMVWRRRAYNQINGHVAVFNSVLDDVMLARVAKKNGLLIRMADGNQLIACRMYEDWRSVRYGFAKNILAGYGNSVVALLLATLFHISLFIVPWVLLFTPYAVWGVAQITLGILARALSAQFSHQRIVDALLMPISVLLMTSIALQSLYGHFTGNTHWKGRSLTTRKGSKWKKPPLSSVQASVD